jgi:hypothetical protein
MEADEGGEVRTELTLFEPQMRRPPIGAKMMATMKSVGRTVFGVRIGCHALSRCCLKAVSVVRTRIEGRGEGTRMETRETRDRFDQLRSRTMGVQRDGSCCFVRSESEGAGDERGKGE